MKSEGFVESIRQRLLNLSRERGEAFDFVLSRYGVERFLYRMSLSAEAGRFVLKGATLFQVWNARLHRPTRDLDLSGSGPADLESVRRSVVTIMGIAASEDGLWFDEASLVIEPIRNEMAYGGLRAKFRAKLGNIRIPVQVDVGFGDAITPGPETREFPALLPGIPTARLRMYPVATVIAEKFEALVRLDEQNTRMKDFFDLDFLIGAEELDRKVLSEAVRATFQRRDTEMPTDVPTGLSDRFAGEKQMMWRAFLRKNGLEEESNDFPEVVGRIRSGMRWVWEDE